MIISNTIDLISYIQRTQLKKDTLFISPVFTDEQKNHLASLYDETIKTCEAALQNLVAKETVVKEPQIL